MNKNKMKEPRRRSRSANPGDNVQTFTRLSSGLFDELIGSLFASGAPRGRGGGEGRGGEGAHFLV